MVTLTTIATGVVGIVFVFALYAWSGYDVGATATFLQGNWSTVLLAVQLLVMYILTASGHKLAGGIVLATALVTVMGKVVSLD